MYKFIIIFPDGVRIERDGFNFSFEALNSATSLIAKICSVDGHANASCVFVIPSNDTIDYVEG